MDTVYPEPTSLLYRRPVRKKLRGNATRYRTQPVTFAEIQVKYTLSYNLNETIIHMKCFLKYKHIIISINGNEIVTVRILMFQEVDEDNLDDIPEATKVSSKKSTKSEIDLNRKFDEFRRLRDKKYSKSENDSPSPNELSPVISPTKDPTAGICHPLDVTNNCKTPGGTATPGKIIQRPSL